MFIVIKIIFIIIGTFVGAGFASGKEILLFFFQYGDLGITGMVISSCFIGIILYKTIRICQRNQIDSYDTFVEHIFESNILKKIIKKWINIFLLFTFSVMISGFCSFIKQEFLIQKYVSYCIIVFFCIFALSKKMDVIMLISNILVPVIILVIIYFSLNKYFMGTEFVEIHNKKNDYMFFVHAILYSNYNLLSMIPITIITSKLINKKKHAIHIAIPCTVVILLLSCCMFFILHHLPNQDLILDFPIVRSAEMLGKSYKNIYCIIIAISIVTTALSVGYTYIENNKSKLIVLLFFSFMAIQFSFSDLLEFLYPMFGIIGLIQSYFIIKVNL